MMEHHIDREIRLSEESEYKNLYTWFLQEFTKDGKSQGRPLIPWPWSFYFTASDLRYNKRIEINGDADDDKQGQSGSETIHATLKPSEDKGWHRPGFSMFGTDRQIEKFSLRIYRLEDDQKPERCQVTGFVSYTAEIDFRYQTQDDELEFQVSLRSKDFDEMRDLIRHKNPDDRLQLHLSGVKGFYSDWSPSITTDSVKVLTAWEEEQQITKPAGCTIEPPRLGHVREFSLMLTRRNVLAPPQDDQRDDDEELSEEASRLEDAALSKHQYDVALLTQLTRAQEGIAKLLVPLWIVVVLLAAILLFKK